MIIRNFVQRSRDLTLPASYDVLSNGGCQIGNIFGVAAEDALTGMHVDLVTEGVFTLPKVGALAVAIGDRVFWDNTAKLVNKISSGNTLMG